MNSGLNYGPSFSVMPINTLLNKPNQKQLKDQLQAYFLNYLPFIGHMSEKMLSIRSLNDYVSKGDKITPSFEISGQDGIMGQIKAHERMHLYVAPANLLIRTKPGEVLTSEMKIEKGGFTYSVSIPQNLVNQAAGKGENAGVFFSIFGSSGQQAITMQQVGERQFAIDIAKESEIFLYAPKLQVKESDIRIPLVMYCISGGKLTTGLSFRDINPKTDFIPMKL